MSQGPYLSSMLIRTSNIIWFVTIVKWIRSSIKLPSTIHWNKWSFSKLTRHSKKQSITWVSSIRWVCAVQSRCNDDLRSKTCDRLLENVRLQKPSVLPSFYPVWNRSKFYFRVCWDRKTFDFLQDESKRPICLMTQTSLNDEYLLVVWFGTI